MKDRRSFQNGLILMLIIVLVMALIVLLSNGSRGVAAAVIGGAISSSNAKRPAVRCGSTLVVDTLNVLSDWTYQKYSRATRGYRPDLFVADLKQFLPQFIRHVQKQYPHVDHILFVMKNMRRAQDVPDEDPKLRALLMRLTKKYNGAGRLRGGLFVEFHVAQYKKKHPSVIWNSKRMHHMRARDDILALHLHLNHTGSTLVSKDKFRDSAVFSSTPAFKHVHYMMGEEPRISDFRPRQHSFGGAKIRRMEIDAVDFYRGKSLHGARHITL